jgi:hypothetical protein
VRVALFWFSLAVFLFALDALGSSAPVSGTPILALALASFTRAKLRTSPLRKHMFGSLSTLQVVLPGLLYVAAAAALILERTESASASTAGGFLAGAAAAVLVVLSSGVLLSPLPRGGEEVRYVCARCGLGSDRASGRAPCLHCGLFTRIEWEGELPETGESQEPFTRLWCPACAVERLAPRGTSVCEPCGQALSIEFNDHATGARASGDGRGLEAR